MLKNYKPATYKTVVEHQLVFLDSENGGYAFPCDANGNLLEESPELQKSLNFCLGHPEKFDRFNELVTYRRSVKENDRGTCICGSDVELWDQYYGACRCPKCGKWYNLFGQSLLSPDYWEMDPSEEEYYEEW